MKTKITLTSSNSFDKEIIVNDKVIRNQRYDNISELGPVFKNLANYDEELLSALRTTFKGLKPISFTFEEKF